jgi:hypothetical protein
MKDFEVTMRPRVGRVNLLSESDMNLCAYVGGDPLSDRGAGSRARAARPARGDPYSDTSTLVTTFFPSRSS